MENHYSNSKVDEVEEQKVNFKNQIILLLIIIYKTGRRQQDRSREAALTRFDAMSKLRQPAQTAVRAAVEAANRANREKQQGLQSGGVSIRYLSVQHAGSSALTALMPHTAVCIFASP